MKKIKDTARFMLMLFLILEVNSQNLFSDLMEHFNKDDGLIQNQADDVDAVVEDTRLKMIHLMRRSPVQNPAETWTGRWFPDVVTESPKIQAHTDTVHSSYTDMSNPVEAWTGRWFPDDVTESPKSQVNSSYTDMSKNSEENWTGRWLPERVTERPRQKTNKMLPDNNMWQMINSTCDDGHTNLTVDWDMSPINYTCFHPSKVFLPDPSLRGIIERDYIPSAYIARHICMSSQIEYYNSLPTFGPHRPAWPKYGEYVFVPPQRWLHNLEHGGVVMLYHPCAHPLLVKKLRKIVKNCLYRHVITPYTLLPYDRPLALLTWGWSYSMPDVDVDSAVNFIQEHALNGPEHTYTDGQYDHMLLEHAEVVSTIDDAVMCPMHRFQN